MVPSSSATRSARPHSPVPRSVATPLWHSWGAQPVEQGGRRHLYFDLYGRVVELAAARGRRAVVLGKGMATLKADLGARLVPQYAVVSA
jgi:hypothetical protein